jgi:hypothetical protein
VLADASEMGKTPSNVLNLKKDLGNNKETLHLTTRIAFHKSSPQKRLVFLVDQFEELFTLCKDEKLRQPMIDNLLYAANVIDGQTIVVLTMRADFYGRCAAYPELAAALSDHQLLIGGMSEDELRLAIEKPAQLSGCEFEPGLVDLQLKDIKGQAGGLPLLQYALFELWRKREDHRLTQATYNEIGGVQGALEKKADDVLRGLTDIEKEICRKIFLRLTQVGEGTEDTKRRVLIDELISDKSKQEDIESIIQTLSSSDARLVTVKGIKEKSFIEVSHEALIRSWGNLRKWLDEDREFLLWRQRLRVNLSEWGRQGHDEGILLRGGFLAEAQRWLSEKPDDLSEDEKGFIIISAELREREQKAKERQRRKNVIFLSTGLIISVILSAIAGLMWWKSNIQQDIAFSRQLSSQALIQLNEKKLDLALLLSSEAVKYSKNVEARSALLTSLVRSPHPFTFLFNHTFTVSSVAFSPDGKTLASGSMDETVILWDVEKRQKIGQPLEGHTDGVDSVAFSPDGKTLASGSSDKTIILWDIQRRQKIGLLPLEYVVSSVAFSPDGKMLVSGPVILWDVEKRQKIGQLEGHTYGVKSVAFSPDGKTLASGGSDKTIILWDIHSRQKIGQPLKAILM